MVFFSADPLVKTAQQHCAIKALLRSFDYVIFSTDLCVEANTLIVICECDKQKVIDN